jgi:hypothetical protein
MKKTFPFHQPGKVDARVIELIKRDLRKYVQRERRKDPPPGFAGWSFDCRVGSSAEVAEPKLLAELSAAVDAVAQSGAPGVYVSIEARPAKPNEQTDEETAADPI